MDVASTHPLHFLGLAVLLEIASFTLYSCFDLLSRRYTGHQLPAPTVMAFTFISYVFNLNLNLNLGSLDGVFFARGPDFHFFYEKQKKKVIKIR